jgi:hypothetical protein
MSVKQQFVAIARISRIFWSVSGRLQQKTRKNRVNLAFPGKKRGISRVFGLFRVAFFRRETLIIKSAVSDEKTFHP